MANIEILGLVISVLGFILFSVVFTIVYRAFSKSYIKDIKAFKEDHNILEDLIKYNHPSSKKKNKIIKAIKNTLFYGLLLILIPFFVVSLVSRIKGNILMFGGNGYLVVGSGSMSIKNNSYLLENELNNQFNTGDIIEIRKLSTDEPKLYDVISYKNDKGINIIHRIIKINEDGTYITRGDSNIASDTYHPKRSDIYGVYTNNRVPVLGYLILFFKSNFGIMTALAVLYCIFMIDFFNRRSAKVYEDRYNEIEKIVQEKNFDFQVLYTKLEENNLDYESILETNIQNSVSSEMRVEDTLNQLEESQESGENDA